MDKSLLKSDLHLVWHHATVTRVRREELNRHRGVVVWLTGLSASGKSTIAHAVEEELYRRGCRTFVLDGDNVRHGLSADLSFSPNDRRENIRRLSEVAKLMMEAGLIVLTAFISPYAKEREDARNRMPHGDFLEIYCKASLATCESRDPKGLYQKARSGEIKEYTGITSPYEAPVAPELILETDTWSLGECVQRLLGLLEKRNIIPDGLCEGNL